MKDVQLLERFYDLDAGGSIGYSEFMKFVLPCNNPQLREDVCQRKTFEVDARSGQKLHESVERALADFFEREINFHIKNEMLKVQLAKLPDWNVKAAYNLLDSQKQGFVSHFNLYGFLNQNKFDASDDELIGIIRRIEGQGDSKVQFHELREALAPINVKIADIQFPEDERALMAEHKADDMNATRPILEKLAG